MALLGSFFFNAIFYLTLIPVSISIIILYFFLSTKKLQAFGAWWIRFVLKTLRLFCGVTWVVEGKENIPKSPCVIVSNHQGQWESFYLQTLFIPSTSIIKKELLYIPFFGWALRCMQPITLNRANKFSSFKKVINKGVLKLKNGFSVILFPEGTRISPNKGIQPFANSCGVLASKSGKPILPICHNSGKYWKNKKFIKTPGQVIVRIGPPITGENAKKMTDTAYLWIKNSYKEIY
jgi:1-acyl-sn-glycerol-3-phosphate acyltransferase